MGYANVSLVLSSPTLDPDAVTPLMGISPTTSWRARDPALRERLREPRWSRGQWAFRREHVQIDDVVGVIEQLAAHVRKADQMLRWQGSMYRGVWVGMHSLRGTGESIHFPPTLLRALGELELELTVDAYGGGSSPPVEQG